MTGSNGIVYINKGKKCPHLSIECTLSDDLLTLLRESRKVWLVRSQVFEVDDIYTCMDAITGLKSTRWATAGIPGSEVVKEWLFEFAIGQKVRKLIIILQVSIILQLFVSNFIYKSCQAMESKARQISLLPFYVLISFLCLAHTTVADSDISDAKKKETVYRMYAGYKKDFPAIKDISPRQAMKHLNQGKVVFVDTRRSAEMAVSMLPGAVRKQVFLSRPDRYREKIVVAYCTISYRSGVFAREMASQGITVINLQGGILAWILEGGKVYDGSGKEIKRVHVYSDIWDFAPGGYESIKFSLLK